MFTDKIELKDFDKMDPEYKGLLGHVLTIQADCEIGGPHLYVETMLPAAPTKLDQLIVARTAAEESGSSRQFLLGGSHFFPLLSLSHFCAAA